MPSLTALRIWSDRALWSSACEHNGADECAEGEGAAELVVALRRRSQLGNQWPMLLAGGVSILAGVAYVIAAAGANPMLDMLVIYASTGGIDFVVQAGLLAWRQRRMATLPAPARAQAQPS